MAVAPDVGAPRRVRPTTSTPSPPTGRRSRCSPRRRSATTSGSTCATTPSERFPDLWMPNRSDLCFATTNRQARAARDRRRRRRGRRHRLGELLEHRGARPRSRAPRAALACCASNAAAELPDDLAGIVGVTAGASAPDSLVDEVIARARAGRRGRDRGRDRGGRVLPPPPSFASCSGRSRPPSRCSATPRRAPGDPVGDDRDVHAAGGPRRAPRPAPRPDALRVRDLACAARRRDLRRSTMSAKSTDLETRRVWPRCAPRHPRGHGGRSRRASATSP